jgi:uncharacterized protein YpmB
LYFSWQLIIIIIIIIVIIIITTRSACFEDVAAPGVCNGCP